MPQVFLVFIMLSMGMIPACFTPTPLHLDGYPATNHTFIKPNQSAAPDSFIPTSPPSILDSVLRITEISINQETSWFEIYNSTDTVLDLSTFGYRTYHYSADTGIITTMNYLFPAEFIAAKSYMIFASQPNIPLNSLTIPHKDGVYWKARMGGFLELIDEEGRSIDFVQWGESHMNIQISPQGYFIGRVPAVPELGYSIARTQLLDTHAATDWILVPDSSPMDIHDPLSTAWFFDGENQLDNAPRFAQEISLDQLIYASMDGNGDVDFFVFPLEPDTGYRFTLENLCQDPDPAVLFDPKIWTYIQVGETTYYHSFVSMNNNAAGKGESFRFTTPPGADRIYIAISHFSYFMDAYTTDNPEDEPPDSQWDYVFSVEHAQMPGLGDSGGPEQSEFYVTYSGSRSYEPAYSIHATRWAVGEYCVIYGIEDERTEISDNWLDTLVEQFDEHIYPWVSGVIGYPSDIDNNGKVIILIYDIEDDFIEDGDIYTAGYFRSEDLDSFPNAGANAMEIIYIDTYPSMRDPDLLDHTKSGSIFETIAHEFSHLCLYNHHTFIEPILGKGSDSLSLWIEEGIAEALSHLTYGPQMERLLSFSTDYKMSRGPSLVRWNFSYPIPNYALSYLFIWYLVSRAHDLQLLTDLISHEDEDLACIEAVCQHYFQQDFKQTYQDWLITLATYHLGIQPEPPYQYSPDIGYGPLPTSLPSISIAFADKDTPYIMLEEYAHVYYQVAPAYSPVFPEQYGDHVVALGISGRGGLDIHPEDGLHCGNYGMYVAYHEQYTTPGSAPALREPSGPGYTLQDVRYRRSSDNTIPEYTTPAYHKSVHALMNRME